MVRCLSKGWRLATIESKEENDMMFDEIRSMKIEPSNSYWTSGIYNDGHWQWLSSGKELMEYTAWGSYQPNDLKDSNICLDAHHQKNNKLLWFDDNCLLEYYPVCEYFV
uniref:C-type lectin domain-containing protein n=1 Tax=Graphocephala atropunctata TaxID=36148 RepID=A0A1B6L5I9_9HEMI